MVKRARFPAVRAGTVARCYPRGKGHLVCDNQSSHDTDRYSSAPSIGPDNDPASKLQSSTMGSHTALRQISGSLSVLPQAPYAQTRPSCVHALPSRGRGWGQSGAGS